MKKNDTITKELPHSKESEMIILGCMLTNLNAHSLGLKMMREKDFYLPQHQAIFSVLKDAFIHGLIDVSLISEKLDVKGELDSIGGPAYLTTLAQYAGTSAYIEEYIEVVRNKSILRHMIESAKLIAKQSDEELYE